MNYGQTPLSMKYDSFKDRSLKAVQESLKAMDKRLDGFFESRDSSADALEDGANRAYRLLEAKSRELGMPTRFQTDLTLKDRAFILAARPSKFLWIVRNDGTDLFPAGSIYRCRDWFWLQLREHPEAEVFLYSRRRLKEIPRSRLMRSGLVRDTA